LFLTWTTSDERERLDRRPQRRRQHEAVRTFHVLLCCLRQSKDE